MTRVALLWHMHQPYYEDLVTHEHMLPWARLHALKDYYGMATLLREFPDIRVNFNLVPSLLVQIEAFAEGRAYDRYLDVGLRPAADLTDADRAFMVENFFHANRSRLINVYPRYAELLAARGSASSPDAIRASARRLTVEELRDLQVWQKLSWFDQSYLSAPGVVRDLVQKGRGFTEGDKAALRAEELRLLRSVIPEYRAVAEGGQAELSTSPFYHPILPLLCDTSVYARTHPDAPKPRRPFVHPEEASEQLRRAVEYHTKTFGRRPTGLWPSEGSVSDEVVGLAADAGFTWLATDELVLARTLGVELHRDGHGVAQQPELLYRPYRVGAEGRSIACVFRDHALSDRIGFAYAGWPADAAAEDFVGRIVDAGRACAGRSGEEPLVTVILDGENPWEYFAYGGRPFLRALYRRLSGHPELRTVHLSDACAAPTAALPSIFPASWIDANFSIWIGHDDDRRAWSQLSDACDAVASAPDAPADALARAREELLIAEGSDWFWWYGDDHSSAHDQVFDDLFRRHVRNAYALLNKPIPAELFHTNITTVSVPQKAAGPCGLLSPTIDGEPTSYFEWLGAGFLDVAAGTSTMHQAVPDLLREVYFGFDEKTLFVRVDGTRPLAQLLNDGYGVSIDFIRPTGIRLVVAAEPSGAPDGLRSGRGWRAEGLRWDGAQWEAHRVPDVRCMAGSILELAIPFSGLGLTSGEIRFSILLKSSDGVTRESHPRDGSITVEIPDKRFAATHWTA